MRTREQCLAAASPLMAATWRDLHEVWITEGREGVARLCGERGAEQYERWIREDLAEKKAGAA